MFIGFGYNCALEGAIGSSTLAGFKLACMYPMARRSGTRPLTVHTFYDVTIPKAEGLHADSATITPSADIAKGGSATAVKVTFTVIAADGMTVVASGDGRGTVRVFRLKVALEDAVGSHVCSRKALACVRPM
jgi:hypothetical protein